MVLVWQLLLLVVFASRAGSHDLDVAEKRVSPALLFLNSTLSETERHQLISSIHRTYKVQDYDAIREDLRENAPRFYSIVADLDSLIRRNYESKSKVTQRRLENYADHSPRDLRDGAGRLAKYLNENMDTVLEVTRKEMLFKFLQAANAIRIEEANALRKTIGDRFKFRTLGEIFGDFERSVPALYDAVLNVSETLAVGVGKIEPGTPEKYMTSSTLGDHELDVLAETFAHSNAEIVLILCTCIVQSINRMSDEEINAVRAVPREDIVLSATRWPYSVGVLNQTEIVRYALTFNASMSVILDKRISQTKRVIAIEFDEDQQLEFIERIDILNTRVQEFLVQFAIISLVETVQKLEEYDIMLLHRYVARKAVYNSPDEVDFELSSSAPQIFQMTSLLMADVEDAFKDRLRFGLDFIDRSWSLSTKDSLADEIEADLAPEIFAEMAKAYGAFATTILSHLKEQVQHSALRLANENWISERPEILRVIHDFTTKYHRTLLRYMRRNTPTVYQIIGPFHLLMEGKKRNAKDPAIATILEILRAESVRVFISRVAGGRARDRWNEDSEDFFSRHFNAFALVRCLTPEQLVLLTKSFKILTPEQREIFESV
ncbi:hypothetical protein PENTCL1PPCAC_20383, partial [Pristionchus entomophagus]